MFSEARVSAEVRASTVSAGQVASGSRASTTATRKPRSPNAQPSADPTMPPPTMMTS